MSLLVGGRLVEVPGVTIIPPSSHGGPAWSRIDPGDYRQRRGAPSQIVIHTTKGMWPQRVLVGAGPAGRAEHVARFWDRSDEHSAAHIVVGSDGVTACLCDLATTAAFHATVANERSVGVEIYQEAGGGIYQAALDAAVRVVLALCEALQIPPIVLGASYDGRPLPELLDGGPSYRGIYGHRSNTTRRGRGDPGDEIFVRLQLAGAEALTPAIYPLLNLERQQHLVSRGAKLALDGIPGPASLGAAKAAGYARWRDVPRLSSAESHRISAPSLVGTGSSTSSPTRISPSGLSRSQPHGSSSIVSSMSSPRISTHRLARWTVRRSWQAKT